MSALAFAAHASSVGMDNVVPTLDSMIDAVRANEGAVKDFARRVGALRKDWMVEAAGFGLFVVATWPELIGVRKLYERMWSKYPLPAWRRAGVRNENIEDARRAIFFYIMFLSYTLVQFPLTLGPSTPCEVAADLLIQLLLLGFVMDKYGRVTHALRIRHKTDPEMSDTVSEWVREQFDDMRLSFRKLRNKTLLIFAASISLVFGSILPFLAQGLVWTLEALRKVLT